MIAEIVLIGFFSILSYIVISIMYKTEDQESGHTALIAGSLITMLVDFLIRGIGIYLNSLMLIIISYNMIFHFLWAIAWKHWLN